MPGPARYRGVAALLSAHAARTPDKPFLTSIDEGRSLSFSETRALAARLARRFAERGVARGDRILVLSANGLDQAALYFAALAYGAVYCTVDVEVNAAHVEEMAARIGPRLVVYDSGAGGVLPPAAGVPAVAVDALVAEARRAAEAEPPPRPVAADAFAVVSFTSGTSAAPKGVIHQHGNYLRIAEQTVDMWKLGADDRVLEYRSFGWASSHMLTLMPCLLAGAGILFARRFSAGRFFDWIAGHAPTVVFGVPTVVNMLLDRAGPPPPGRFAGVRFMSCSTAPLMVERHRRFEEAYGVELVQLYGMSEGGVVAGNHAGARRIGSVGPPGLYQNLRIVGADGAALAPGETGEIEIGGAQNGYGYLHPGGRVERIRGRRLKTGDLGYLDADGFLHVAGRAKEVVIRGGVNVSPLEVDNAIAGHPDVAEAATIGVSDPVHGEALVSFVALRPGARLGAAGVKEHCARALPEAKRPREVVIRAGIPRNDRGKIDRGALRRDWDRLGGF